MLGAGTYSSHSRCAIKVWIRYSCELILVQSERDEALCRAKRTSKQAEKACQQLIEAKAQIAELKAQLVDAADNKICALERARKIDELQSRCVEIEKEKSHLIAQLNGYKMRCRSTVDSSMEKTRRDEHVITVSFPWIFIKIGN